MYKLPIILLCIRLVDSDIKYILPSIISFYNLLHYSYIRLPSDNSLIIYIIYHKTIYRHRIKIYNFTICSFNEKQRQNLCLYINLSLQNFNSPGNR